MKKKIVEAEQHDLIRRAMAAWFRSGGQEQAFLASVEDYGDLKYVVLRKGNKVLKVYRDDGLLKSLRRHPFCA